MQKIDTKKVADTIKSLIRELKDAGYLKIEKQYPNATRGRGGKIEYVFSVFETPQGEGIQEVENQTLENQTLENQTLENRTPYTILDNVTQKTNKTKREKGTPAGGRLAKRGNEREYTEEEFPYNQHLFDETREGGVKE